MYHLLLFLPPRAGMTDAERVAESVYVPACRATIPSLLAPPGLECECLGHTRDISLITCPACQIPVAEAATAYPMTEFAYGPLRLESSGKSG